MNEKPPTLVCVEGKLGLLGETAAAVVVGVNAVLAESVNPDSGKLLIGLMTLGKPVSNGLVWLAVFGELFEPEPKFSEDTTGVLLGESLLLLLRNASKGFVPSITRLLAVLLAS